MKFGLVLCSGSYYTNVCFLFQIQHSFANYLSQATGKDHIHTYYNDEVVNNKNIGSLVIRI